MKKLSIALVLLAAAFASGCVNLEVGHKIDSGKVAQIIPGETTKDDVKSDKLFGAPMHTVAGADGEIWVYRYMSGGGVVQELTVGFTDDTVSCFYSQ